MSEDAVIRMRMLSTTDTPAVSTILEEMFQFVDGRIPRRGKYKCQQNDTIEIGLNCIQRGKAGSVGYHHDTDTHGGTNTEALRDVIRPKWAHSVR